VNVDIVIVNFNTCELLRECLVSISEAREEVDSMRTIVVDNASTDASVSTIRSEFPWVELVPLPENLGFGAGNNRGVARGQNEFILFLNSDAKLTPQALSRLASRLQASPLVVAVGPRLIYPDGSFQPSCRRFPTVWRWLWSTTGLASRFPRTFKSFRHWLDEEEHVDGQAVDMVSGACFLMRRDYFESIGGFDENLFLYEEEFDVFYPAARRELEVGYCGEATVIHGAGKSVEANRMAAFARFHLVRSKYYAFRKHYGRLAARLAYWVDLAVFGTTGTLRKIRGKTAGALLTVRICRLAWPASRLTGTEVRSLKWDLPG
jgi:hypothetical protein